MDVPYFIPWITREDKKSVIQALDKRWLVNGPILDKFEQNVKTFVNTKYSVGVTSGTHALHLVLTSLGIGPSDEVIVPTFTFAATANVVTYCGAKPVLVDVDSSNFNLLSSEIKKKRTKKTKAVIVVHYGGQAADMDQIIAISRRYGLHVIEDCAHALGSTFQTKKCGSIGKAGCFSFYPTKMITTGEGGMITTNDQNIYRNSRLLRLQGMNKSPQQRESSSSWRYDIVKTGYNYLLDEIRASLGLSQMNRINEINLRRIRIAKKYDKLLGNVKGITIPARNLDRNHIYHLYTIKIDDEYHLTRDQLYHKLHKNGIGASVQYYPLHLMSYNKKKYDKTSFPNANKLKNKILSLPIFPTMTIKQIEKVVRNIR